jgi:hypothetical protein
MLCSFHPLLLEEGASDMTCLNCAHTHKAGVRCPGLLRTTSGWIVCRCRSRRQFTGRALRRRMTGQFSYLLGKKYHVSISNHHDKEDR